MANKWMNEWKWTGMRNVHFRFPAVAQKRRLLKLSNVKLGRNLYFPGYGLWFENERVANTSQAW